MVPWQIINILSLRPNHASGRFTASASARIKLLMVYCVSPSSYTLKGVRASQEQQLTRGEETLSSHTSLPAPTFELLAHENPAAGAHQPWEVPALRPCVEHSSTKRMICSKSRESPSPVPGTDLTKASVTGTGTKVSGGDPQCSPGHGSTAPSGTSPSSV